MDSIRWIISLPHWNASSIDLSVSCASLRTTMVLCQSCEHSHHTSSEPCFLRCPSFLANNQIRSLLPMKNLNPSGNLFFSSTRLPLSTYGSWKNMRPRPWIQVTTSTTRTINTTSIPSLQLSRRTQRASFPHFTNAMLWWKIRSIWWIRVDFGVKQTNRWSKIPAPDDKAAEATDTCGPG